MPNTIQSASYDVEYGKREGMCMPRDAIKEGERVLVIDDLVATGGTLSSAIELVRMAGGVVVECACIVELKFLIPSRVELYKKVCRCGTATIGPSDHRTMGRQTGGRHQHPPLPSRAPAEHQHRTASHPHPIHPSAHPPPYPTPPAQHLGRAYLGSDLGGGAQQRG